MQGKRIKRIVDYCGSIIGLVILGVPILFIILIVKITSKGPALYVQKRIGKDGKPFDLYKIRSMYVGSDNDTERIKNMHDYIKQGRPSKRSSTKIVNEQYVTRIGKFLRKTNLDELPQLINVLKGEMSLVGPRPCVPYEYEAFNEWHKQRQTVLPGCTGIWQVSKRSEIGFNEMVKMDLIYINQWSLWFDLKIIFQTIPIMLFGRGGT